MQNTATCMSEAAWLGPTHVSPIEGCIQGRHDAVPFQRARVSLVDGLLGNIHKQPA